MSNEYFSILEQSQVCGIIFLGFDMEGKPTETDNPVHFGIT